MGKAGIKLKTAKTIFTMKKMKKKLFAFTPLDNCASLCIFWKRYKKPVIIANKTLTRGPARATIILLVLQAVCLIALNHQWAM
jgi:hypothetical protein